MTATRSDGLLALGFRCDGRGRTVLAERRQRFPLRMTVPLYLDSADAGMAFVYVQNPTGGVFAGDRLELRVEVAPNARVHVTTQSATKLYRMDGKHAVQDLFFSAASGSYVEYVPDPLIPHAGADLTQTAVVDVAHGGRFIGVETVAPGRLASGERFAYQRLRLRTMVRRDGRELCVDALDLEPGRHSPTSSGGLGGRDYLASLLVVAPEDDPGTLASRLDAVLEAEGDVLAAAAALPNGAGAAARVLASSAIGARRAVSGAWRVAREHLIGLPLPTVPK